MSSKSVKASVLHGVKDLRIDSVSLPPPGPLDLQIDVRSTTLCGSDLHYYHHYRLGDILVNSPMAPGHEASGIVTSVGDSLTSDWSVGDRVALEVGLPCENCDTCKGGQYNLCAGMRFRSSAKSTPHFWGTLQETINHPAKWCHKLPPHVSYATASLLEPLSVAIHSTRRTLRNGSLAPGSTVLIIGAGAVGLLVGAMAKLSGASRIIITDINEGRTDFAVKEGFATQGIVVPPPAKRPETIEEKLAIAKENAATLTKAVGREGSGADATFECTGMETCVQTGIYATRPGGTLVLVGMGVPIQTLPISAAALREVDIVGSFRYANTYPAGIEIVSKGLIPNLEKIITHTYHGLSQVGDAFSMASRQRDDEGNLVIKVECSMPEK
ncbi:GroES-like protein [Morchella conica CCBAS932]|uniref:GroES-like protein n=1 Tax=Morchella conica CCBAS932 TaxID=1392247 RepID=A0A3N4L1F2_9PEZI|nr:GroES-like protein [Morchella conica CCBAS932]